MNTRYLVFFVLLALSVAGFFFLNFSPVKSNVTKTRIPVDESLPVPRRIISLSPSNCDLLSALGVFDRVVAVTNHCEYPPETRNLPKVGGYQNPNLETMLSLKPDLIVLNTEHKPLIPNLDKLNLPYTVLDLRTLDSLFISIIDLAEISDVYEQGLALQDKLNDEFNEIQNLTRLTTQGRPKVLLVIGRKAGSQTIEEVVAAGHNTIYHDLLEIVEADNIISASANTYPQFSAEGILALNPDVIVEIGGSTFSSAAEREYYMEDWQSLDILLAVQNNRVKIITDPAAMVPGSRLGGFVSKLARSIHPELARESTSNYQENEEPEETSQFVKDMSTLL